MARARPLPEPPSAPSAPSHRAPRRRRRWGCPLWSRARAMPPSRPSRAPQQRPQLPPSAARAPASSCHPAASCPSARVARSGGGAAPRCAFRRRAGQAAAAPPRAWQGRAGCGGGQGVAAAARSGEPGGRASIKLLLCKIRRAGERHAAGGSAAAPAAEAGARVRGNLRPGVGQCGGSSERARRRKQAKQRTKATRQYGESDRLATDVARLSAPLAAVPLTPGAPPHLRPRLLPPPNRADVWWRVGWRRRRL